MRKILLIFTFIIPFLGFPQEPNNWLIGKTIEKSNEYKSSVRDDGGEFASDHSDRLVKSMYLQSIGSEMMDSVKFMWFAEGASSKEENRYAELHDMSGLENNGTQTTESAQPYVFGDWIPSGHEAMKNPNGDGRYITHPTISFAADEPWSVTTVCNLHGSALESGDRLALWGSSTSNYFSVNTNGNHKFRFYNGLSVYDYSLNSSLSLLGKNTVVTVISNGLGSLSIYKDGIFYENKTGVTTSVIFDKILTATTATIQFFRGTISSHIIRAQALTPAQVLAEANLLQSIYPEIPSVTITDSEGNNAQTWAVENCEMVATPMGSVIANVTEGSNVEKITNSDDRDFSSDTGFWTKSGGSTINNGGSGVANILSAAGLPSYISRTGIVDIGKWYRFEYDITRYVKGQIRIQLGTNFEILSTTVSANNVVYLKCEGNTVAQIIRVNECDIDIDNISIQEIGWAGSQDLYDGLISQGESVYDATKAASMWCYYNNDTELGATYGKLYNWFAASLIQQDIDLYNASNPDNTWGWHVPSSTDFTILQTNLGGSTVAGGKMKVEGFDYWNSPNIGASNSSGFSVVGTGARAFDTGSFIANKQLSLFWAITKSGSNYYRATISKDDNTLLINTTPHNRYGFSLRLIKD